MGHQRQPEQEPEYDPEELGHADGAQSAARRAASGSLVGQTLEGRYRFDALLGEGTFARVYRVHDRVRQVDLAAKVLRSDIAQEPAFLERFRREAEVLGRLQHPHIVRYYDIVESGRHVFILTDYIEGDTLQWRLREQHGTLTPFDSLRVLRPLMAALNYAHQEGVVHRDLKPANILIDPNEHVYVMDFGIAKILTDTSTLTVDMTVGTPHYMSPEQILAAEVTPATDVYALGIILYQMYTGQLPFVGESDATSGMTTAVRIAYEHLHVAPTPPTRINRRLSVAVEDVVLKCLEKDPGQRYQSVSAVYEALVEAVGTPSIALEGSLVTPADEGLGGERVPTAVGGLSRVSEAEEFLPPEDEDEDIAFAGLGDAGEGFKRKRKPKRQPSMQEVETAKKEKGDEKEGEKQTEKQKEQDEKEREKGPEKADLWGEVWTFGGTGDRLSRLTWGLTIIWAGVVFMLGFGNWFGWVMTGAGSLMLLETAVRLVVPEFRAKPGARMVMGSVLLTVGLGIALSLESLWPLVLIAIGASMLINHLVE